jgi:hypothetical protein
MKAILFSILFVLAISAAAAPGVANEQDNSGKWTKITKEVFSPDHIRTMGQYIHQGNMILIDGMKTGTHFLTSWSTEIFTFRWVPGLRSSYRGFIHCCGFLSFGWLLQPILSL